MRTIATVLLVLTAATAAAQESALRLTLEDAQMRAVAASHRLAEARARQAAAQDAVTIRGLADRPLVGASAGYTRTNHVTEFIVPSPTGVPRVLYPDVPDNYRTRLDLQWPIYAGGRTDALERAAQAEASAAAADVEAAQADLRLEVARAFWALVTARATVAVLDEALTRSQAQLADTRARFKAGFVPPNEVAAAEAQESRQRMLLIEARNQRDLSSADLARLAGVDLLQPIEPSARLDAVDLPASPVDRLIADARAQRRERRALELRIEAAEHQTDAAAGGKRPAISVAGGFDYARPNPRIFPRAETWDDSWELGIGVSWALWDGGRTRAEMSQAANLAGAARSRLAEFDSVVALEVQQRRLETESGRAAVVAAMDAVRAAAEARRVVAQRYQAGVATQTEILDADVALLQAELDRTRALAAVRLAEARLARAVGR
ncbi:MAG: TolC family protein [Acidimicrobiia bacterium]|nr:TolC family protein [Acidimicrobiia bacterium]